jgi:hypothetical protein
MLTTEARHKIEEWGMNERKKKRVVVSASGGIVSALGGVTKDKESLRKLPQLFPDSTFAAYDGGDLPSEVGENEVRDKVLNWLRMQKEKAGNNPIVFVYSGHGVPCKGLDGRNTWCLVLPVGYRNVVKGMDIRESSPSMLEARELMSALRPNVKLAVVDACHSGKLADMIAESGLEAGAPSVFLAALEKEASVETKEGGPLVQRLLKMMESAPANQCKLDLDGDSHLSDREAMLGILGSYGQFYQYKFDTGQAKRFKSEPPWPGDQPHTPTGIMGGVCVLKISEKCPVQPRKENTMSCESERKVLGLVESDLRKIAGSKDLDFLQVTSDQDRASESERRRSAAIFFTEFNKFAAEWKASSQQALRLCEANQTKKTEAPQSSESDQVQEDN